MKSEIYQKAPFAEIRYGQCWEDADVLLSGLDIQPGDGCLSIASAGDNTLSLLTRDPARVVALDLNPSQLACLDLRIAAYRELEHGEFLELMGARSSTRRGDLYARCRPLLKSQYRAFWDCHPEDIDRGVGHSGKFERYFELFRERVLPWIHCKSVVQKLLIAKSREEREEFYENVWNNWRWKILFRVFFSRAVMGRWGRDPAFFDYVEGGVSKRILERARHALVELDPSANPYLHWILQGEYRHVLPHAWRAENYECIRARVDRVESYCLSVEEFLERESTCSLQRLNLSDIFEYMAPQRAEALLDQIVARTTPMGRLVYWNMLASRQCPPAWNSRVAERAQLGSHLHFQDKAFFYSKLIVEEVAA